MENKNDKLNKKIYQYKKDYSLKYKIVFKLKNQNKDLLGKREKQNSKFEKSLTQNNVELETIRKQIEDIKAQATMIDSQKAKQTKEELKKAVTMKKVLNDDNSKLLQIVKNFRKCMVEQIGERQVSLS